MKTFTLLIVLINSSAFASTGPALQIKLGTVRYVESSRCPEKIYLEEVNDAQTCLSIDPKITLGPPTLIDYNGTNVKVTGRFTGGIFFVRTIAE